MWQSAETERGVDLTATGVDPATLGAAMELAREDGDSSPHPRSSSGSFIRSCLEPFVSKIR